MWSYCGAAEICQEIHRDDSVLGHLAELINEDISHVDHCDIFMREASYLKKDLGLCFVASSMAGI